MHKYETERVQKAAILPELERKAQEQLAHHQDVDRWIGIIQQYTEIAALDESILFELVDRIEVSEAEKRGSVRVQDIKVCYRYVGYVDDALTQERRDAV